MNILRSCMQILINDYNVLIVRSEYAKVKYLQNLEKTAEFHIEKRKEMETVRNKYANNKYFTSKYIKFVFLSNHILLIQYLKKKSEQKFLS